MGVCAPLKIQLVFSPQFEPGSDDVHYCKPTSVAVESSGDTFYVADGYCNSRIIKYTVSVNKEGYHNVSKIMQWGKSA